MLRIESGRFKGAKLSSPPGDLTRPTTGKVRGAIGDMLRPYWEESRVLDLFSGSGVIGLESLSRGARSVQFVEKSRSALKVLQRNIEIVKSRGADAPFETNVLNGDVNKLWKAIQKKGPYQIVWADPPYDQWPSLWNSVAKGVSECLDTVGFFIVEHSKDFDPSEYEVSSELVVFAQKRYGQALVTIYRKG